MINRKKNLLRWFVFYSVEMALATVGFVYGFGLEVKSWPILIGTMLFARFVFHLISTVAYFSQAQEKNRAEDSAP